MSEFITLSNKELDRKVIEEVLSLQEQYPIGSSKEGGLPELSSPWRPISIGNDECKLLAEAVIEGRRLFVKRYYKGKYAMVVFRSYQAIEPFVRQTNFPIQLPTGVFGDALIFLQKKLLEHIMFMLGMRDYYRLCIATKKNMGKLKCNYLLHSSCYD